MISAVVIVCLSIMLLASLYVNGVFYGKLVEYEDFTNKDNEAFNTNINELITTLTMHETTIKEVAGMEVVSSEPFVRRVVLAISEACQAMIATRETINAFTKEEEEV